LNTLELLVLWRGQAGWVSTVTDSAIGGSEHLHRFKTGNLTRELWFDPQARTVLMQGQRFQLRDANVVLIDRVDSSTGPVVFGTVRIDPDLPDLNSGDPVPQLVRRSPELLRFVQ
jgi:hypothetical protein